MKTLRISLLCSLLLSLVLLISCGGNDNSGSPYDKYDVYQVEVKSFLNVRSAPAKTADKLFTLDNGAHVYVTDISDGWAHIISYGREGYVSADYITLLRKAVKEERDMWYADKDTTLHDLTLAESNKLQAASNSKVMFVDSAQVLTEDDKLAIANALIKEDQEIVVYTCDSVPVNEIYSFADDKWNEFNNHSWYEFNNEMTLILYARDQQYIAITGKTRAIKYIHTSIPERYFQAQYAALSESPGQAILGMETLLMESIDVTNNRFFLKNWSLNISEMSEVLLNKTLVQNLMPTDGWLHKYVFSWLMFIPLSIAKGFMCAFGSLFPALIMMSLLFVLLLSVIYHFANKSANALGACLVMILNVLYIASALCFSVFMDQSMENIIVMQNAGLSERLIDVTLASYLADSYSVTWLFCIFLFVVMLLEIISRNHVLISYSFLPKNVQVSIIKNNSNINALILDAMKEGDDDAKIDTIYTSDNPMREALFHTTIKPVLEALMKTLPAIFVLSGQWLYFLMIVTLTRLLAAVGKVVDDYIIFKQRKLIR